MDYEGNEVLEVDIDKVKTELRVQLGRWQTDKIIDCPDDNNIESCQGFIEMLVSAVEVHNEFENKKEIIGTASVAITTNDIAIVKLAWSISYTNVMKPVCLTAIDNFPLFTSIEISGFGKMIFLKNFKIIN